ncbi:WecB/TagA/CpsF family glycosyltransferase [Candidatus Falkowbacteria bacterium]|uniref:Glycosyltransferase n=1 Tax=Candidatus Buchananbacteria bacterium CG10_big_fil_rev_8_21_14_0_10_33_19 TaxID=1974525 RepID=A0A2H0W3L5_9BACT|nr:WecB/TagA/CpsF family glycosyltransferase [Candidatus Falkowbacteria bacterium]PIS05962.1 MAG: hypothetical protein COT80_04310 [Candidatus Buchananbacteria bacterium CG10_big_fil_rev_8_21_14_0_10_33_19]
MKKEILGVGLDIIDADQTISKITEYLQSNKQYHLVTVNPEFIVESRDNKKFKNVLNKASLAVCDGFGLVLVTLGKLKRVTGVDLSERLLGGEIKNSKVFLLGGTKDNAKILMTKYPGTIVGAEQGGNINIKTYQLDNNDIIINKIIKSKANILLVGFGQVKQEMWISQNLSKVPNVKVAIGVGGTFDYLSGDIKRAPKFFRSLGLEWLYRLTAQPQRLRRIFNATIKFLWLVALNKLLKLKHPKLTKR